jgi:hypothetical protein
LQFHSLRQSCVEDTEITVLKFFRQPHGAVDQNKGLDKLDLSAADMKAIESGNAARLIPRLQSA